MLYDVILRQRLESKILDRIEALVARVPGELHGYLSLPIVRRHEGAGRRLQITVITATDGWFVSTGGSFHEQHDTSWLGKLDIEDLKACLRFLDTGKDLGLGLSVDAALRRARDFKRECDSMQW